MSSALSEQQETERAFEERKNFFDDINFDEIDEDLAAFQQDIAVQQALQRGVDLKKYAHELEKDLKQAENESVDLYVKNEDEVHKLNSEMQECDRILGRMEEMLHGFQADLGEISTEIRHLQNDSLSMSIKLKNRRLVEEKLYYFLEHVKISPDVINTINTSTVINDAFLHSVQILADRLQYLERINPPSDQSCLDIPPCDTAAARNMLPELEKLKVKAIVKIKDYFHGQFSALRKPKTNVHMLQENSLLNYSFLFHFLQKESLAVADELRTMYVEGMNKTLFQVFKSYCSQLMRYESVVMTKQDLLVTEDSLGKSLFAQKSEAPKRSDIFSLNGREVVLEQIEKDPVLIHMLVAENVKYPYEYLLRSVLKHLVDATTNEFLFVLEFFKTNPKDTFNRIFGKTISMLLENIENYLLNCHDIVSVLLMIKMIHSFRLVMQRRRIPMLDLSFDRISLLLWPRFKQLFDHHTKSLKSLQFKKSGPTGSGALPDLSPHYTTKRFAELVSTLLTLQGKQIVDPNINSSVEAIVQAANAAANAALGNNSLMASEHLGIAGGGEHMILQDIQILSTEMIALLERFAATIPHVKEQKVLFINNYDAILTVFQDKQLLHEEVHKFEIVLLQERDAFADEEVKQFFPHLVDVVIHMESIIQDSIATNGHNSVPNLLGHAIDEKRLEKLAKEFGGNWRIGIQQMNDDVLHYFANSKNGMEILKQVLTQLVLYYTRFQDIIKKLYTNRAPSYNRDIVSTATILMEIKRYSRTF